jgi:hypothetical protein
MNIDKLMDDLIKEYSEDQIRNAYGNAVKRQIAQEKEKKIADARSKVLASLTNYFIAVWGKADKDLIKEFENQLIDIEKKAGTPVRGLRAQSGVVDEAVNDDDEKLRKFIEDLLKY